MTAENERCHGRNQEAGLRSVRKKRRTIGFMATVLEEYQDTLLAGMQEAARERDVNLLCFAGGYLTSSALPSPAFDPCRAILYDLAGPENVDGIVAFSGAMQSVGGPAEMMRFLKGYIPLPIVSIGLMEGVPSIDLDVESGMREMIVHLIEVHGYRQIAFIRGPKDHIEAEARYRAYLGALAEYGIETDPDLVVQSDDWSEAAGMAAIDNLLAKTEAGFQAVVGANDRLAIGAMTTLRQRGSRVPQDVAVVGFDDIESGRYHVPSLTTVHQPIAGKGQQAVEMVLRLLDREAVPKRVVMSTEVLTRRSCGCLPPVGAYAPDVRSEATTGTSWRAVFDSLRPDIVAEVQFLLADTSGGIAFDQAGHIVDALADEIEHGRSGIFMNTLDEALQKVTTAGGDVCAWQDAISVLHRHALSCIGGQDEAYLNDCVTRLGNLAVQARVLVGSIAEQTQGHKRVQFQRQAQVLGEIGQALSATFDLSAIMDLLATELPRLGIPSVYVSLYENPSAPTQWSRLVLAYDEARRIALEPNGRRFPTRELVPAGILPRGRRYSVVIQPLSFQQQHIGFALFEMGPEEGMVYESLRGQLSGALQGARLVQQMRDRGRQLQTAAELSRNASEFLDPDQLIKQFVDLVRERFNLYYCGIFLVDENDTDRRWAVLKAGTGQAGQTMLEQGHRFEIGGASMIGGCIADKQPRIALDVGDSPVRFDNPLLPDTHSELALPLVSRGRAIGALTIQSSQLAAFSDADVAVFETMAGQVGAAIENAHLVERTRTARKEIEASRKRYLTRGWKEIAVSAHTDTYETDGVGSGAMSDSVLSDIQEAIGHKSTLMRAGADVGGECQSALTIPIALRGVVVGALSIRYDDASHQWTDSEVSFAEAVTERMILAAENLRLGDETKRRVAKEQLIGEVSAEMRASLDLDAVVRTAVRVIGETIDLNDVTIELASEWLQSRARVVHRFDRKGVSHLSESQDGNSSLPGLTLPITVREKTIGRLSAHKRTGLGEWQSNEISLLESLNEQLGHALESARLFEDTRRRAERERLVREITEKVHAASDIETIAGTAAEELAHALGGAHGFVKLSPRWYTNGSSHKDEDWQDGVLYEFFRDALSSEKKGYLPQTDEVFANGVSFATVGGSGQPAALVAPIKLGTQVIGVLGLQAAHKDEKQAWGDDDSTLVEMVADRVGQALEAARLYGQSLRRARREQLVTEISGRIRSAPDMDGILRTAVQEIRRTLGVSYGVVRLGTETYLRPNDDSSPAANSTMAPSSSEQVS